MLVEAIKLHSLLFTFFTSQLKTNELYGKIICKFDQHYNNQETKSRLDFVRCIAGRKCCMASLIEC